MAATYGKQLEFCKWFAAYSGLNVDVVVGWALQEQAPESPATPGGNNWLNIQYTDSGPNSTYYAIAALNPQAAAKASVLWMEANQPTIVAAKGKSAYDQALAIVNSGWASSKYGGIGKFYSVVQSVGGGGAAFGPAPNVHTKLQPAQRIVVVQQPDPKDSSPKIRTSGQKLSATGTSFLGHKRALRSLLARSVKL